MPIANNSPRFEKIASPAAAMNAMFSTSGCPSRRSSPATGSTAIGSMKARPICCRPRNICFIVSPFECPGRHRLARLGRESANETFDMRNDGRHRRELSYAKTDQDRHGSGIGSEPAADSDWLALHASRLDSGCNQTQYGWVSRVQPRRKLGMPAIDGERVLRQIV